MNTILVDDELWSMRAFQKECEEQNLTNVTTFNDPCEALDFAKENTIELALLDIEMPKMNGLELGKALKELYPEVVIIYVTAHDEYAMEVIRQKADYIVTKPYNMIDIKDAIDRAKLLSKRQRKPIFIRTFGNFDVFVNGKPIYFSSGKAKELLALLVDKKGGILTTEEALAIIWEDKAHNDKNFSLCRTAASRLRKTLNSYNIGHILVEEKAGKHLDTQSFDCDYYMTLKGNQNAENSFSGEYMSQYSWAEDTLAALLEKK